MFSVTLRRTLASKHFMPEMEGPEKEVHAHQYKVEVTVMGEHLDDYGFLVNVDAVAASLEKVIKRFEGEVLNAMPDFYDIRPSMENIAKAIWSKVAMDLDRTCVERIRVTIWEAEDICASYEQ